MTKLAKLFVILVVLSLVACEDEGLQVDIEEEIGESDNDNDGLYWIEVGVLETDSWSEIRIVTMGGRHVDTLYPEVCYSGGFSESFCPFEKEVPNGNYQLIIEFIDDDAFYHNFNVYNNNLYMHLTQDIIWE